MVCLLIREAAGRSQRAGIDPEAAALGPRGRLWISVHEPTDARGRSTIRRRGAQKTDLRQASSHRLVLSHICWGSHSMSVTQPPATLCWAKQEEPLSPLSTLPPQ